MPELSEASPEILSALDSVLSKDTSIPMSEASGVAVVPSETVPTREEKPPERKEETKVEIKTDETKDEKTAKADDDYEPPENLGNEGRKENWARMRSEYDKKKTALKERDSKIEELQKQLTDFDGTKKEYEKLHSRLEELTKQNEELSKIDSLSKLENHPDFKRKYVEGKNASMDKLKKYAEDAEIPVGEMIEALGKSAKEKYRTLDDLLSNTPSTLKTRIMNEVDRLETLDEERGKELSDARTNLQRLEEQRAISERDSEANEIKVREALIDRVIEKSGKDLPIESKDAVKKFFMTNDSLERAAEILIEAENGKLSKAKQAELEKELGELRQTVKSYKGASASVGSGHVEKSDDGPREGEDYVSYMVRKAREA